MSMKRTHSYIKVAVVAVAALSACTSGDGTSFDWRQSCQRAGLCDTPALPPVVVDIALDHSAGSTGTRENFATTIDLVLRYAAERPGSRLRVWLLGTSVETTRRLADVIESPAFSTRNAHKRREESRRWIEMTRSVLVAAVDERLSTVSKSPIAAALSKVALAETFGLPRHLIVLTDAREYSALADFECKPLPTKDVFLKRLHAAGLLAPRSFTNTSVYFSNVTASTNGRCSVELAREIGIRELWRAAFVAAGAIEFHVTTGPVELPAAPTRSAGVGQ